MKRSIYAGAGALAALTALTALHAQPVEEPPTPPTTVAALPGALAVAPVVLDRSDRLTMPVMVNGQGPFAFVVDSGAERTVIARELAERLALPSAGRARVVGLANEVQTDLYHLDQLTMGSLTLDARVVPVFSRMDIGAAGLLGIDSLAGRRVVIDFRRNRIDIHDSPPARQSRRAERYDPDAITVVARERNGRLILSNAEIDHQRIDVVLDTGAQASVGNQALRALVHRRIGAGRLNANTHLRSVTGASLPVTADQIRSITIDGLRFDNLPVHYGDSPAFDALGLGSRPTLLLGMDALQLFDRVSIDFTNRRVTFQMPDTSLRGDARRLALAQPAAQPRTP